MKIVFEKTFAGIASVQSTSLTHYYTLCIDPKQIGVYPSFISMKKETRVGFYSNHIHFIRGRDESQVR